jgi:hypothetical protein
MSLVIAFVGALVAWSLFGNRDAKRRAEYSGMEKAMMLLGLAAFGYLFAVIL